MALQQLQSLDMILMLLFDCVGQESCRVNRGVPTGWLTKLKQYDQQCHKIHTRTFCLGVFVLLVLMFSLHSSVLTLKLSHLLSERDRLMTLLVASLVLEYHMRPPSERRTIVAFSVISST